MKDYAILVDAICDLDEETSKKYDLTIIPAHVVTPDKVEMIAPRTWDKMDIDEFYASLKKHPLDWTVSPASVQEMANVFEDAVNKGLDIISIGISDALSGTVNFMAQAKDLVLEKHPDARITIINSKRYGFGYGVMAINASLQKKAGKTYEEVVDFLETNKNRFHQAGWLDDLQFVARKGRMTHAKAFFGQLAGIQPIGEFDSNGMVTIVAKAKGAKAAMEACLEYFAATCEDPENQPIFIANSNRRKRAEMFKTLIEERFGNKNVFVMDAHPAVAINLGPGLMAAYYMGTPISEGLVEERALYEKALAKK